MTTHRADELRAKLIRNFDAAAKQHFERAALYESMGASLADGTAARDLGIGIDIVPPGKRSCPYHFHHAQEEMFIVLEGQGTLRVAGEMLPIGPGDVIFIPAGPEYPHHLLNTSEAPLKYLSISTQQRPEVCEYPDSGKVAAFNRGKLLIHRKSDSLDYWEGEP
ncbi:MAG: cupin domain-containing protein [Rubrivivax sp.]|nr:cupin domain-containing protein [Rubrivivax sp.]